MRINSYTNSNKEYLAALAVSGGSACACVQIEMISSVCVAQELCTHTSPCAPSVRAPACLHTALSRVRVRFALACVCQEHRL